MGLKISRHSEAGIVILQCSGRIRFGEETTQLRDAFNQALAESHKIVLDLGGVGYIDSNGIGTLVGMHATAESNGAEIKLANLTQRVNDALQITRLGSLFELYDGQEQAVAAFRATA